MILCAKTVPQRTFCKERSAAKKSTSYKLSNISCDVCLWWQHRL
jgi:hypothetical protein